MRYSRYIVVSIVSIFLIVSLYSIRDIIPILRPSATNAPADEIAQIDPLNQLPQAEQDTRFMTDLSLMKGHLVVGEKLLEQGTPDQAEPHLGHPIVELYDHVAGQLAKRNAPDFKPALTQLYEASRYAPAGKEVVNNYALSMQQIDQAIATLPEAQRLSPAFILKSINDILAEADLEYRAGIAHNEVVEVLEYQDAMGFTLIAQQLYETIANQVKQTAPEVDTQMTESFTQLKKAWPSINRPSPIVMTPDEMSHLIARIKSSSEAISANPS